MKKKEHNIEEFSAIFEKLEEAKVEQLDFTGISESDYSEIHESVQKLQEIQQCVDTTSYTFYTRT